MEEGGGSERRGGPSEGKRRGVCVQKQPKLPAPSSKAVFPVCPLFEPQNGQRSL